MVGLFEKNLNRCTSLQNVLLQADQTRHLYHKPTWLPKDFRKIRAYTWSTLLLLKVAFVTVAKKTRALHYPWKLRVMNSKRLDSVTSLLADQTDSNDCFRLWALNFTVRFLIECPKYYCYTSLSTHKIYQGGDLNAPDFRFTIKKATKGDELALVIFLLKNWWSQHFFLCLIRASWQVLKHAPWDCPYFAWLWSA